MTEQEKNERKILNLKNIIGELTFQNNNLSVDLDAANMEVHRLKSQLELFNKKNNND